MRWTIEVTWHIPNPACLEYGYKRLYTTCLTHGLQAALELRPPGVETWIQVYEV